MPRTLICLLLAAIPSGVGADEQQAAKDRTVVQTLLRLPHVDVNARPKLRDAVLRHLKTKAGTLEYVELVEKLKLRGVEQQLLGMAIADPSGNVGVNAATLVIKRHGTRPFDDVLASDDEQAAAGAATVLGFLGTPPTVEALRPWLTDEGRGRTLRTAVATALGRSASGQQYLLELATKGELPSDVTFAVANALLGSSDPDVRRKAAEHLQLPQSADAKPLPPVAELVAMKGDPQRGATLFQTTATCSKCHRVRKEGKEVGPDLSEIGSKLSREALFASILDPSAGISHNYETYTAILLQGTIVTGVLVSRTDAEVTLRTAEAIDRTLAAKDLDELVKTPISLMPADLQKTMDAQGLVDVVEYLTTLKKPAS